MSDWNPMQRLVETQTEERAAQRSAQTAREYLAELELLREAVRRWGFEEHHKYSVSHTDECSGGMCLSPVDRACVPCDCNRPELQAAFDRAMAARS